MSTGHILEIDPIQHFPQAPARSHRAKPAPASLALVSFLGARRETTVSQIEDLGLTHNNEATKLTAESPSTGFSAALVAE